MEGDPTANRPIGTRNGFRTRARRWGGIAALAVALLAAKAAFDARHDDRRARPTPLSRVFAAEPIGNRHVEITGLMIPRARIVSPSAKAGGPAVAWEAHVAMIGDPPRVLLVRFARDPGPGEPRTVTVSGMLRPPDASLVRTLDEAGWRIADAPIEPRYVLAEGSVSRPSWLCGLVSALFAVMAAGLLVTEIRRHAIDEPGRVGDTGTVPNPTP